VEELWNDISFIKDRIEQQIQYRNDIWKTHDRLRTIELCESADFVLSKFKQRYHELSGMAYCSVVTEIPEG
jgi:hypothetical protein